MANVERRLRLPIKTALFVVVAGLGVRALLSEPSLTFAVDEIAKRLHDELGLSLTVAHIEAQAQSARVFAGPVVVKGTDGAVLFSAARVDLELEPLKFFDRRLRLAHLEITDPHVSLRIRDGALVGVRAPDVEGGGDPLLPVDVADFQLHGGQVDVVVEQTKQTGTAKDAEVAELVRARLEGIELRLSDRPLIDLDGLHAREHRLRFDVERASVTRPLPAVAGVVPSSDTVETQAFGGELAVEGDGLLQPERISVAEVLLSAAGAELRASGSVDLESAHGRVPAFSADLAGGVALATALEHAHLPVAVKGDAHVSIHVEGKAGGEAIRASGEADALELGVEAFRLGSMRGRFLATFDKGAPPQIEVTDASWDWADTVVHGSAVVKLDDAVHVSVNANGEDFSIYSLLDHMDVDGAWADAQIDAHARIAGTLRPLLLEGSGTGFFHDVIAASRDVRTVPRADLILITANHIRGDDVKIHVDDEGVRFSGTIDDGLTRGTGFFQIYYDAKRGLIIDAEGDRASFASIGNRIGALEFGGNGRGHLHVEGPQSGPVLTAELEVDQFSLEDFQFGDAKGRIHLKSDVLSFLDVIAVKAGEGGASRYGGTVVLDFTDHPEPDGPDAGAVLESPHLTVDVAFDPARAQDLRAIIPGRYQDGVLGFLRDDLDLVGPVRGHVKAWGAVGDGTFDHTQIDGVVELVKDADGGPALLGQHLSGASRFHMDKTRFFIDTLDVDIAGGKGHAEASVGREHADLAGAFDLRGMTLPGIDALKDASKPFAGTVDVAGTLGRVARDPGVSGRAILKGAAYGNVPIGDADVQLEHAGRVLTLKGMAMSGRGDTVVHVETRSPFNYTASVSISDGPLRPLVPVTLLPEGVDITTGGDVDAKGALKTMRDSRGNASLHRTKLKAKGLEMTAQGDVAAHFWGTRLTFDVLDLESRDGDRVSARGLVADDAVDLQLSGQASLRLLPKLWARAESADGRLSFDVAVTGDLDAASASGQAFVSAGKLKLVGDTWPALSDIDASLLFRGENVVVERLTCKLDDTAPFSAQGSITIADGAPSFYDLEARYTKLRLHVPANIDSSSSGRLTLKGDAELPTLSGEVRVHSARYTEDLNWERVLPDLRRRSSALDSLDTDDEDVRFDVHLIADRGITVENNVLDLEAKGDVFLTGTEERPGLKGGLQLVRGNATFRNNRYRLTRGTVDFVDTYRILPILDVEAETKIQDYDVTAHVTGQADAPTVDLTSRPELSEIDIISLLTFGFTQYEVRDAGGSAGAAGLEVVSAYTGLDKELRRVLPDAVKRSSVLALDELRLTSQFSLRAGASVPAVAVGMEVNPGVLGLDGSRLRLQSTLVDTTGNGTEQRVELEKRFDNDVRLRLVWNSEDDGTCPSCTNQWGDLGGDLWYRWEF